MAESPNKPAFISDKPIRLDGRPGGRDARRGAHVGRGADSGKPFLDVQRNMAALAAGLGLKDKKGPSRGRAAGRGR